MGVENANTRTVHKFLKNFSNDTNVTQKNLFHNSIFRMKRRSATLILTQNNKACNGTNESVKIVISLIRLFADKMENNNDC